MFNAYPIMALKCHENTALLPHPLLLHHDQIYVFAMSCMNFIQLYLIELQKELGQKRVGSKEIYNFNKWKFVGIFPFPLFLLPFHLVALCVWVSICVFKLMKLLAWMSKLPSITAQYFWLFARLSVCLFVILPQFTIIWCIFICRFRISFFGLTFYCCMIDK